MVYHPMSSSSPASSRAVMGQVPRPAPDQHPSSTPTHNPIPRLLTAPPASATSIISNLAKATHCLLNFQFAQKLERMPTLCNLAVFELRAPISSLMVTNIGGVHRGQVLSMAYIVLWKAPVSSNITLIKVIAVPRVFTTRHSWFSAKPTNLNRLIFIRSKTLKIK